MDGSESKTDHKKTMVCAVIPGPPFTSSPASIFFAVFDWMNLTWHITLGDHLTKPMDAIRLLACRVMFKLCPLPLPLRPGTSPPMLLSGDRLRLPNPPAREPADHREGKCGAQKHPWYANQWQARLQDVPVTDHGLVLFMQAARWADDIRIQDKSKIDRVGITSTFHSNPRANRRTCKPENPTP